MTKAQMTEAERVTQGLAVISRGFHSAHCSHADGGQPGHVCVGSVTVSREGILQSCKLCGTGDLQPSPETKHRQSWAWLKRILDAAGVSRDKLSIEARRAALAELRLALEDRWETAEVEKS